MANATHLLAGLDVNETGMLQPIIATLDDDKAEAFAASYRAQRKDPQTILLTCLLGFILIGGVQRFLLGQTGMGLLYVFTLGICGIGTIIDLINYKTMTLEYNQRLAQQIRASIY